jgi:hypothetical protein
MKVKVVVMNIVDETLSTKIVIHLITPCMWRLMKVINYLFEMTKEIFLRIINHCGWVIWTSFESVLCKKTLVKMINFSILGSIHCYK